MAFYNENIAKNKSLRKAWRAGHQIKLDDNEEICLPEICAEIARWMRRDRAPRKRLSLRSCSVMLCGAIRLYRAEVDNLLRGTFNFNWTNKRAPSLSILRTIDRAILPSDFSDNSEEESFVLMPKAIQLKEVTGSNYEEIDTSSAESSQGVESEASDDDVSDDESTVFTVPPNDKLLAPKPVETRDQGFQTQPCTEEPERNGIHEGFNPNLPFGYIIVHDNYNSRIPSKILFSSVNENVKYC